MKIDLYRTYFSRQLNTDCRSLAKFNTQRANRSLGIRLKPTHSQTLFDTEITNKIPDPEQLTTNSLSFFLRQWGRSRLTQFGREKQSFTDSRGWYMCVRLLTVAAGFSA
jgi:hypothetical protein